MLPKDDADWTPCSEGTLSSMIERVRTKRRQINLVRWGASTLAVAFVLILASFYFSPDSSELECRHIGTLLAKYRAGGLDQSSRQFVEQHLVSCEKCRIKLGEMQADEMGIQTVFALPLAAHQKKLLLSVIQPLPHPID